MEKIWQIDTGVIDMVSCCNNEVIKAPQTGWNHTGKTPECRLIGTDVYENIHIVFQYKIISNELLFLVVPIKLSKVWFICHIEKCVYKKMWREKMKKKIKTKIKHSMFNVWH